MAASIGWAVRDHSARLDQVASQARESYNAARALVAENKPAAARQKLAEAQARLGNDRQALGDLAAAIDAGAAELDQLARFLEGIDRAHEVEIAPVLEPILVVEDTHGRAGPQPAAPIYTRHPTAAAPLLLQALELYGVLTRDDWSNALAGGLLGPDQLEHIRRSTYEELLWLADDAIRRQVEHRPGRKVSPEAAARLALFYLARAEGARPPTLAFYVLRASCRKCLGDEAAARADGQRAAQALPALALDHYLRGLAVSDARQLAEAVRAFEAALRLEPTHYWSLMRLGYCLCELGRGPEDFTSAARVFSGCILKRPDHAHAYYCRGNAHLKLGQDREALADLSRAIELEPRHTDARCNRGITWARLGQPEKAAADFTQTIELDPRHVRAWHNRGALHLNHGQPEKAIADLSQAIERDPQYALAWRARGDAYRELGQDQKAVADLSQFLVLDPKNATAWYNRGDLFLKLGQPEKAIVDCSRAIELRPEYAKAWCNRGTAYSRLGQPEKAVADDSRAIELDSQNPLFWHNRGVTLAKLGQLDRAVADFSRAVELDPKLAETWKERGHVYGKLNQPDRAVADFSRAIELNDKDAHAWFSRAFAYIGQGQLDRALTDLNKTIELDPNDARAWNTRGITYGDLGQLDRSLGDYDQAIKLDPILAQAWNNRGGAYLQLGQPGKAISDFDQAIKLNPNYANAWFNRGQAYLLLGQPDRAVEDLDQAAKLNFPRLAPFYLVRAEAQRRQAHFAEAVADYQRALKLLPANAGVHNELAWLLATCPDATVRDPNQAVLLAKKAAELAPKIGNYWGTLGTAHYRAREYQAAVLALEKAIEMSDQAGPAAKGSVGFFLAMAHGQLGNKKEARRWYDQAVVWMEQDGRSAKNPLNADELRRFRSEAEEVLELKK
jgi:tetratricopeptide (TPR) repeat protein